MSSEVTSPVRRDSSWASPGFTVDVRGDELLTRVPGHEFTGTVEEAGSEVKNFRKGDQIVSPFTVSWYKPTQTGRLDGRLISHILW